MKAVCKPHNRLRCADPICVRARRWQVKNVGKGGEGGSVVPPAPVTAGSAA